MLQHRAELVQSTAAVAYGLRSVNRRTSHTPTVVLAVVSGGPVHCHFQHVNSQVRHSSCVLSVLFCHLSKLRELRQVEAAFCDGGEREAYAVSDVEQVELGEVGVDHDPTSRGAGRTHAGREWTG